MLDELVLQVQNTVEDGKIPIVTFQHYEACQTNPMSAQKVDMDRLAQAGAMIVSGSQAHCPQSMTFVEDSFVHYGLGNLFFDQMWDSYRNSFLDYHVFYNGQYLGVQLLTTRLEDASQPRPMTGEERALFLEKILSQCDWGLE
jgi:poly-gamma-glutamate capsule biosynthesis protein CapA/YwtB (metallophosphatase superfamily)